MIGAEPNCTTEMTLDELEQWIKDVRSGEWQWSRNAACKYVSVHIDTRSGVYALKDRDGNEMSADQLTFQFSSQTGTTVRPRYKTRKSSLEDLT